MTEDTSLQAKRTLTAAQSTYCMDGGVLLAAQVPEEAIVAKINKGWDHFHDDEYLVDRRALGRVEVIEREGLRL
jgi:hypothetical protein